MVAIADTNCNPDDIDYIIPGNDDAVRAIRLICSKLADACVEGHRRAEEKLKAESELSEQAAFEQAASEQATSEQATSEQATSEEATEPLEKSVTAEDKDKGPEIIVIPKKEKIEIKKENNEE